VKTLAIISGAAAFTAALIAALIDLPPPATHLPVLVDANLQASGVAHPVTAVLLNFRGYDTLLEIGVLLLALLVVLALGKHDDEGATPAADLMLQYLARLAAPLMVLIAVYLLWAGAHQPGGAFQAGAVLAAAAVLLHLAGLLPAWRTPGTLLRSGLAAGFIVFLVVASALGLQGTLLQYPPAMAGALILLIESALTFSLGLILAGLFMFLSADTVNDS
jgi:multisubunit Na+/H+ antiporter MnhB subunit